MIALVLAVAVSLSVAAFAVQWMSEEKESRMNTTNEGVENKAIFVAPTKPLIDTTGRHSSTEAIARFFRSHHLPPALRQIAEPCERLAAEMIRELADGPELTSGLRKLLEAKDCFVRARL